MSRRKNKKSQAVSSECRSSLSLPPLLNVLRNQHNTLQTQLMLLRMAAGSFPEKDFPKLSTVSGVKESNDNKLTKVARVLVNKDLNEKRREQLVGKLVENSLLVRIQQALINSKGQMTPALRRFLTGGRSKGQLKRWKNWRNQ